MGSLRMVRIGLVGTRGLVLRGSSTCEWYIRAFLGLVRKGLFELFRIGDGRVPEAV